MGERECVSVYLCGEGREKPVTRYAEMTAQENYAQLPNITVSWRGQESKHKKKTAYRIAYLRQVRDASFLLFPKKKIVSVTTKLPDFCETAGDKAD